MSDTPIHEQRLRALQLAVQKKAQFNTLHELRNIRMMEILSFLIEFECATASTLLDLVEVQNNSILTRMVKEKFIKIHRWQNSQVYVPTATGKSWLLEHLDDDAEIARVLESKIRRKISGYSAEHDLLVQRAAIHYARDNAAPGENWRLFKPRKTDLSGPVPDAKIIYTRAGKDAQRVVWVEIERTPKPPVETICKFLQIAKLCEQTDAAAAVFLCTRKSIANDYSAVHFALDSTGMTPPQCVQLNGFRHGLLPAGEHFDVDCIDVAMIDDDGDIIYDDGDQVEIAFSPVFWALALKQSEQRWQHWAEKLAHQVISDTANESTHLLEQRANLVLDQQTAERHRLARLQIAREQARAAQKIQADLLTNLLAGPDPTAPDNPYRAAMDLNRARQRYAAMWR